MKKYRVVTRFSFTGTFFVNAKNRQAAKEYVEKHCGLVIGGNIHSTLSDEDVDWEFPVHPDKTIGRISVARGGTIENRRL
ncbi:hypothetical protein AGMMS50267_18440 [Spirochaetia bacterium]|nr:hypothetical protein AGMMS50267_18440 [Spirochaetia bacterium]